VKWSPEARLAAARACCARLDGGTLCLYAGEKKAAELRFSDPAFHGDHMNPIAPDESADGAEGVDNFVALNAKGGLEAEGSCGALGSGADCELKSVNIPRGARVEPESLHFTPGA